MSKATAEGAVEWAITWPAGARRLPQFLLQHYPHAEGGTHEQGLRTALDASRCATMASASATRRARQITADDVMEQACAVLVRFHPRAGVSGPDQREAFQRRSPAPGRERRARSFRSLAGGSAARGRQAARFGGHPGRRPSRAAGKRKKSAAQDRDTQTAPSRQARRLLERLQAGHGDLPRRRRLRRRLGQTGARPQHAGDPARCAARS